MNFRNMRLFPELRIRKSHHPDLPSCLLDDNMKSMNNDERYPNSPELSEGRSTSRRLFSDCARGLVDLHPDKDVSYGHFTLTADAAGLCHDAPFRR
jgi:hypothetical protein